MEAVQQQTVDLMNMSSSGKIHEKMQNNGIMNPEDDQMQMKGKSNNNNGGGGGGGGEHAAWFQMPLHYPRYSKADYESMEEWKIDRLLQEYGLPPHRGSLAEKRCYAMGVFLWN